MGTVREEKCPYCGIVMTSDKIQVHIMACQKLMKIIKFGAK